MAISCRNNKEQLDYKSFVYENKHIYHPNTLNVLMFGISSTITTQCTQLYTTKKIIATN